MTLRPWQIRIIEALPPGHRATVLWGRNMGKTALRRRLLSTPPAPESRGAGEL